MLCRGASFPALLVLLLLCASEASAQISGSVVGTVRDSTTALVPGATVTLANADTGVSLTTITTAGGDFRFPLVPVGRYTVTAELSGFRKSEVTDVLVELGEATRANLILQIGNLQEAVVVSGTVELLQTESGAVHAAVRHEEIVNLPLNGRNFIQLVALQPHAVPSPRTSFLQNLGGYNTVAGAPVDATTVTIDGVNIRDISDPRITITLNPDVIQEFQESQSTYSAAQGLGAGAQINLVTKSGTNLVHGSVFEFVRDDKLDVKNYFDREKPPFNQDQYGFSLGGPLRRNRTFFFAGYEGLRKKKQETRLYTVATAAQRRGDFSGGPTIFDPLNRDSVTGQRLPFAGNIIPTSRFAPEAVKALQTLFPDPNLPGSTNNLLGNPLENGTNDQFSVRIDHKLTASDSLFGRYIYFNFRRQTSLFTALPNFTDKFDTPANNLAIGYVRILGPNTTNQFRFGYHRMTQILEDSDALEAINQNIGINGTSQEFLGNPNISISGLGRTGGLSNTPNNRTDSNYYLYDDLNHSRGRHALALGFNIALDHLDGGLQNFARGNFSFTPRYTAQIGVGGTGSAVADFLLGYASSSSRGVGSGFRNFRQRREGAYFNDDWKVADRLTMNLGVRWEYFGPGFEANDRLSAFDPATGTIITAGQNGVLRGLRKSNYTGFQPRAALAYRLPGEKTVLRGGYGLYFMPLLMTPTPFGHASNAPFYTSQSFTGDAIVPNLTLRDAFPAGIGVPSTSLSTVNRELKDPYLHQWNVTVQRALTKTLSVELGYLGNRGERLRDSHAINAPPAGPGPIQSRRPYPAYSGISIVDNTGRSRYHGAHVKVTKRFSDGLQFNTSYTWSRLLDRGGIVGAGSNEGDTLARNPLDPESEWGLSVLNARHRAVGSAVWVVPIGSGHRIGSTWSGWKDQVLGQWQLNGIFTYQSGPWFSPSLSFDNANNGSLGARPDTIGDPNSGPKTVAQWFNTTAFALPPAFSYGNTGRNTIQGPPVKGIDVSVFKSVKVGDGKSLQFRAEIFNLMDWANFDPPGRVFGTPSFGVISSAGDARQIQFAVKFVF